MRCHCIVLFKFQSREFGVLKYNLRKVVYLQSKTDILHMLTPYWTPAMKIEHTFSSAGYNPSKTRCPLVAVDDLNVQYVRDKWHT